MAQAKLAAARRERDELATAQEGLDAWCAAHGTLLLLLLLLLPPDASIHLMTPCLTHTLPPHAAAA